MSQKSKDDFLKNLIRIVAGLEILAAVLIFFFTKNIIYCIISLTGAAIGITGFFILIRLTDRILEKGKDKTMFFLTSLAKLLVIAGTFFIVSRLAKYGIIFFIQGLAMIYLGIVGVGIQRLCKNLFHGT
ncbi:MAG: hypothetical protein L6428_04350 [Candidatus Aminicenantes bacterium]|nr:hypothetical protein [Acidobacteriota bacterium]MCG2810677.1 hypothetical protein [Candidatus Aminicenantes bacterium]